MYHKNKKSHNNKMHGGAFVSKKEGLHQKGKKKGKLKPKHRYTKGGKIIKVAGKKH